MNYYALGYVSQNVLLVTVKLYPDNCFSALGYFQRVFLLVNKNVY